jgi:hypothetical protein
MLTLLHVNLVFRLSLYEKCNKSYRLSPPCAQGRPHSSPSALSHLPFTRNPQITFALIMRFTPAAVGLTCSKPMFQKDESRLFKFILRKGFKKGRSKN